MKNWKRTLIIGLVWGYVFFGWYLKAFFKENWNFNLFSIGDWQFLADEFQKGWGISETGEWVFVSIVLLMGPLYLFVWRCLLKVKWMELLHRFVNKLIYFFTGSKNGINRPVKVQLNKNSSKTTKPKALESGLLRPISKENDLKVPVDGIAAQKPTTAQNPYQSGNSFSSPNTSFGSAGYNNSFTSNSGFTPPQDSPFLSNYAPPASKQGFSIAPSPLDEDDFDKILLEDIKLPQRTRLEEDLPSILEKANYSLLQNVKLGDISIDYLAIGNSRIIACQIDSEEGDWLADEERFNGEDPLWFSESSHRVSPVFRLVEQIKKFSERLSVCGFTGTVAPIFVEKKGTIINAEDMLTTWKELGIAVCRTDMGGPDELKSFTETIVADTEPSEETIAIVHNAL